METLEIIDASKCLFLCVRSVGSNGLSLESSQSQKAELLFWKVCEAAGPSCQVTSDGMQRDRVLLPGQAQLWTSNKQHLGYASWQPQQSEALAEKQSVDVTQFWVALRGPELRLCHARVCVLHHYIAWPFKRNKLVNPGQDILEICLFWEHPLVPVAKVNLVCLSSQLVLWKT